MNAAQSLPANRDRADRWRVSSRSHPVAFAQRIWVGGGGFYREPPKWATPADFDGSFLYCRGFYRSVAREAGGQGWSTDYPGADNNFSVRLAELTRGPRPASTRIASRTTSSSR